MAKLFGRTAIRRIFSALDNTSDIVRRSCQYRPWDLLADEEMRLSLPLNVFVEVQCMFDHGF